MPLKSREEERKKRGLKRKVMMLSLSFCSCGYDADLIDVAEVYRRSERPSVLTAAAVFFRTRGRLRVVLSSV